jgi:1,4-alpha-glucan branching enzyme
LLKNKQQNPLTVADITPVPNQLKVLVDLCHLHGIAVVFDVVYNHAGGFDGDDESLFFWDRGTGDNNSSLYFTNQGWAGGLSFALWKQEVRQFLIDNALFHQREFHVDGLRYDEISALVQLNQGTGRKFCEDLTDTVRFSRNRTIQNAEFWPVNPDIVKPAALSGAGFDVTQHDGLRLGVRQAIGQASGGVSSFVSMDGMAGGLYPNGFYQAWQAVSCVENHDEVLSGRGPRIPRLADGSNSRSFFARSRSRVATGILLLAPGIPQIFMGQEFLEDKQWNDDPSGPNRIYWGGVDSGDKPMVDFLRFTQDLLRLRWTQPAVRSGLIKVFHVHNGNRVLAFHRWIEGVGHNLVVVVNLNDQAVYNYQIGFPYGGRWGELFNSDVYDEWVNPNVIGNGGQLYADGGPMHGFDHSGSLVLPPNSILVFGG